MSENNTPNAKPLDFGDFPDPEYGNEWKRKWAEKNLLKKKKETYYKEFQRTDNGDYIKIYTIDSDGKKQYLSLKGKKVSSDMQSITIGETRHTLVFRKKEFDYCMYIGPVCDCMFPYFCIGMLILIITLIALAVLNKI